MQIWKKKISLKIPNRVVRNWKSKDRQYNGQIKRQKDKQRSTKQHTLSYRSSNKSLTKTRVNSCALEKLAVPVPLVKPVLILLNYTRLIWYASRVGLQYKQINTNNISKTWVPCKINWSEELNIVFMPKLQRTLQQKTKNNTKISRK